MMKYTITSSLTRLSVGLALAFVALSSCKQEFPKTFDEAALDRQDKVSHELLTTLTSSEHGWILDYYPQSHKLYGGYVVAMKFGASSKAQIISESPVSSETTDSWTTGAYHIKNDKGVTLSFDSYIRPLHIFSDPDEGFGDGQGKGFEGDFEFTLSRPITPDTIYLRGRKTLTEMRLVRAKADAKSYLASVKALKAKAYTAETMYQQHLFGLEGTIGKKPVIAYLSDKGYNTIKIHPKEEGGEEKTIPFICTPTGIHLYSAYEGVSDLTWDDAQKAYTSSAGDKLVGRKDPDYEGFAKYLGKYQMQCDGWQSPREVTFVQHARNVYAIEGAAPGLTILADYDAQHERFEITTQKVKTGATTVRLCPWAKDDGDNLSWGAGYGMYSKLDASYTSGKKYVLVDNGVWGNKCDSFILWVINQGPYGGFGGIARFAHPTFVKL